MHTINNQIKVKTKVVYGGFQEKQNFHAHSYTIRITNHSLHSFQLLRRHWKISNGLGYSKMVNGDGVIGEQPIINPGKSFSYSSWCPMPTSVGTMKGEFYCVDLEDDSEFTLDVPKMTMVASDLQN